MIRRTARSRAEDGDRSIGKLRGSEFRYLLDRFRDLRLRRPDLEGQRALAVLLDEYGAYWHIFYELSLPEATALLFVGLRLENRLREIAGMENPTREFLAFMREGADEPNPLTGARPEKVAFIANLVIALCKSLEAVGYYSLSINELLKRAASGDRVSLLHAIAVDRLAIVTDTAVKEIAKAQLCNDRAFFSGLFKRAKNPHLGRKAYVDLRFAHRVLQEAGAIPAARAEELLDVVQGHLGLYNGRRNDPVKGLSELFRRWQAESTTRI